jgi:ABC-2 type transport system ATP-binding protein
MVEVRNLSFSYSRRRILRDVSFSIVPGETVGVVGANGAGKTTLLKIMATLAVPDGGSVTIDGQDAFSRPLRYRRQLGYLPEKIALYEDLTVRDFLAYRANLKGEPPKRVRRRVSEASEICFISQLMHRSIRLLSAGEKKRVALADALLLRPRLLLLDDFFAGLDVAVREAAGGILANVATFSGVVATGHEIEELVKISSRILVLSNGCISDEIVISGKSVAEDCGRVRRALVGGGE